MRAPWNRRGQEPRGDLVIEPASSERKPRWSWRSLLPSRRETPLAHGPIYDPWLRLARDYLLAQGARIRTEEASRIVADLPDGSQIAYTDTRGHDQDGAFPLVPGSAAATEMIAAIEARSRSGALRLAPAIDALALAASFSAPTAEKKGRSQTVAGGLRDVAASPQQDGGLVLHWEKPPSHTSISRSWESASVEVEYRFTGRDHFGRIDDTLRVTADPTGGVERPVLDLSQATMAQSAPLTSTDREVLKTVLGQMDERLRPDLEAAASFLRLRSQAEYRRRIETAQGVAERARREQPEEARQTEQALKQEVAAISAVFAVEVEASVTAAWVIHSPMADVIYHLPGGTTVEAALDLGRAAAEPLTCAVCQQATREATICAHAHILCPACRDLTSGSCGLCTGAVSPKTANRSGARQAARAGRKDASPALSLEGLARLGPAMWRACIGWLLEQQGYTLNILRLLMRHLPAGAVWTPMGKSYSFRRSGALPRMSFRSVMLRRRRDSRTSSDWSAPSCWLPARQRALLVLWPRPATCVSSTERLCDHNSLPSLKAWIASRRLRRQRRRRVRGQLSPHMRRCRRRSQPRPSALKQNRPSHTRLRAQHWRRRGTSFARRESRPIRRFWHGRRCSLIGLNPSDQRQRMMGHCHY